MWQWKLTNLSDSRFQTVTVLSKDPLARRFPSQLHATECTCTTQYNGYYNYYAWSGYYIFKMLSESQVVHHGVQCLSYTYDHYCTYLGLVSYVLLASFVALKVGGKAVVTGGRRWRILRHFPLQYNIHVGSEMGMVTQPYRALVDIFGACALLSRSAYARTWRARDLYIRYHVPCRTSPSILRWQVIEIHSERAVTIDNFLSSVTAN